MAENSNKKLGKDKSLGNLIPAKAGEIRNPNGRPKKENCYSDTLRSLLEGQNINVTWTVNGKSKSLIVSATQNMYYGVAASQIMEALKGNVAAQKEIVDRIQGKAPQTLTVKEDIEDLDDKLSRLANLVDATAESNGIDEPVTDTTEIS
jgi:hypothetical protein